MDPRSNFEGKEASVIRGETKIRDKRSVTVRFAFVCGVNVRFERDRQFDYVNFFCLGKVGLDRVVGLLVGYVR